MKENKSIAIRRATEEDLPEALNLIRELAAYERAPDEVTLTVDDLRRDGFGEHPVFEILVAEEQGQIVGMTFSFLSYSTWKGLCLYLEDIIVKVNHRRRGIGTRLFEAVIRRAAELNARRVMWQVLNWNMPAIVFYRRYSATFDSTWVNGKLTEEQIKQFCHDHEQGTSE
jgi:GNAT superfamily N-acetyltransferase